MYFRINGVSLRAIGGLRLLELPYSLKVFWSPLVHRFGDRRHWILVCMLGIAAVLFALPFVNVAGVGLIVLLLILALTTFRRRKMLPSIPIPSVWSIAPKRARPTACALRRIAWRWWRSAAARCFSPECWPGILCSFWPDRFRGARLCRADDPALKSLPEEAREHWLAGFAGWAGTWKVIPLILFVLTYKLGEFAIGPMVKPFWVDYGKTIWPVQEDLMFQIGLFPTTFGIVLSVVGALMGGAFISRYGIFRGIWFLGSACRRYRISAIRLSSGWISAASGSTAHRCSNRSRGGLGTAAFLAFLMNVCQKEHATVQYAFLSSVFSLTGRLVGAISGLGAEKYGFANYFAITFLLSMPAYLLLPWVKPWIQEARRE